MSTDFGGTIPKQGEAAAARPKREGGVAAPTVSSSNKSKGGKDAGSLIPKTKQLEESPCDAVGTKLVVRHAFGYGWAACDEVTSYQSSSRDKDVSDRLIYRVGNQVCIVDPEGNNAQRFLSNRPKHVARVLHVAVSKNNRYVSVCERVEDKTHAQISIYSLTTLSRSKTLQKQVPGADFVQSCFFAESKYLAVLMEAEEQHVIVYHWEKEKQYKSLVLPSKATKLCTSPAHFMLTVSGPNLLRHAYLPPDGMLKLNHMFGSAVKENDNFLAHSWMPFQELNAYRVIALGGADEGSHGEGRHQLVHIFEGPDTPYGTSGPPISLELKTTISLRLEAGGAALTLAVHSKGFVLFGLHGMVSLFERTEDKREPFVEARRLLLGGPGGPAAHPGLSSGPSIEGPGNTSRSEISLSGQSSGHGSHHKQKDEFEVITSATVLPSEETVVMLTRSSRVLSMPLAGLDVFAGSTSSGPPSLHTSDGHEHSADRVVGSYSVASSPLTDLHFGGNHRQRVCGLDVAFQRPVAVTVSPDHTLRIWNYESMKCELSYEFSETPYAVAVSSSGFQVVVSFKDKIRMYNVLQDKLRLFRETTLKGCKELKLSHNNSFLAAAAALSVYVYDTKTLQQVLYLQGHIGQVRKLCWAPGDMSLFSSGADGNVYGWSLTADLRMDVSTSSTNRSSPVLCLAVDGQTPGIIGAAIDKRNGRMAEDYFEGGQLCKSVAGPNSAIVGFGDGVMKVCEYSGLIDTRNVNARSDTTLRSSVVQYDAHAAITALCISIDKKSVYAGLANGCVRAYPWPFMAGDPPYVEVMAHAAPVVEIREAPTGTAIVTAAEDGTVFFISTLKGDMMSFGGGMEMASMYTGGADLPMNSDLIVATREDIEEHVAEVQELQKRLQDALAKTEFAKHNLELAHAEEVRKLIEGHHQGINAEKDRYEALQSSMDGKLAALRDTIKTNEQDHIKTAAEIENRYEHKLADQFERYDRLSEEMEAINQKCQGLLAAERAESERLMSDLRADNRHREKKLKSDFKRVRDERATDENAFKEILDQQEDEYENELKQLIAAAEDELKKERETITKYQTFAQTQTTKLDQYNKRYREVQEEYKKGLEELKIEKREKQELLEAVEHYKKNLQERDIKLADKDKLILELRSNIRTLENFRVVLDHRQQQLNAEKGPITEHIVGLENHIRTMYEELVEEFEAKKAGAMDAEKKDLKLTASLHEISRLRADSKQKEVYISAFKRDLENVLGAFGQKELEEAVHKLYRKYIKGEEGGKNRKEHDEAKKNGASKSSALANRLIHNEGDSDNDDFNLGGRPTGGQRPSVTKVSKKKRKKELLAELNQEFLDNAKEANRQRAFIERSAADLKHRLELASLEQVRSSQRRLHENSHLVFECNELRAELRSSARKLKLALEEKDRLMVALANSISSNAGGNPAATQVARTMLKTMAVTATTASEDTASVAGSTMRDNASVHSKMSTHSTRSIDSRKIPASTDTPVEELVAKSDTALMHSAKEVMDDRLADDLDAPEERSLTSTGAEQRTEAEKWWDNNGGSPDKPPSPLDSRRPSQGSTGKPTSAGLANSYSTNALPNKGNNGVIALSKSTPLLAHARIPNGGRPVSRGGALSSLMLPALPSEDLGSMSDIGPQGQPLRPHNQTQPEPRAINPLKSKLIAKRSNPAQTLNTKANASHNAELRMKRAATEIDQLTQRLDDSEKEKIQQQAEINRLRNQMQKMHINMSSFQGSPPKKGRLNQSGSAVNNNSIASSVFVGSHRDDGLYPPEMQTAADATGVPSNEDLDVMRVSSAKGSARGLRKPAPPQDGAGSRPQSGPGGHAPAAVELTNLPNQRIDDEASLNSSLSAGSARR